MDLKKKMKSFFTLKRRANDGFTLVELIVVIAILAILGGVAVPAYSGYVKKAEQAADDALLAELNMAFASACNINGENHIGRKPSPKATISGGEATVDTGVQTINDSFDGFYEGGLFKTMTRLSYDAVSGMFKGYPNALNSNWNWTGLDGIEFWESSYAESGIDGIAGTVDDLTGLLAHSNSLTILRTMPGFADFVKTNFGLDANAADSQTLANAAVFFVANKLSGLNASDVITNMQNDTFDSYLDANIGTTNENERNLVKAALQYGMAKAYVDSLPANAKLNITDLDGNTSEVNAKEWFASAKPTNLTQTMNIITNVAGDGYYQHFLGEEIGETDLETLLGTMGALNSNKGAFESVDGSGLFSSDEVQNILNQYWPKE